MTMVIAVVDAMVIRPTIVVIFIIFVLAVVVGDVTKDDNNSN